MFFIALTLSVLAFGLVGVQGEQTGPPPGYAGNWRPLVRDDDIISKNFEDVDIKLLSPAFLNPDDRPKGFTNGTSAATSYEQLDSFLRTLASRNDWMNYITPDFLSEEGRPLPYLYLTNGNAPLEKNNKKKIRLLIESHIHGDEPGSEEAVLALLGKLDNNSTWTRSILDKLDILVIPRANPDGAAYFQSQYASGFNPNRDFAVMNRQQTRDLISLHTKFHPHIFVDCHEFGANWRFGKEGNLVVAADSEVDSQGGLNRHPDIFDLEYNLLMRNMYAALKRKGLRTSAYFTAEMNSTDLSGTATSAQYASNHGSLYQAVSILIESRGVRLGDQHFQRRVAANLILLTELIQTAVDNADHVYKTIEDARKEFINSDDDIVLTSKPRDTNITWEWIDAKSGKVVEIPVTYQNFTPPTANLTRSRPEAYVFTRAWADVVERLRVTGVEVQELDYAFDGEVEALKVESTTLSEELFEGIVHNTITTSSFKRRVHIPAGGFWVSTRQLNAAFAFNFLEPENIASAAIYNIIPLLKGNEYPIYRVLA
ncbi:hypothetical protein FSST1_006704 [Fusarium sambucinum]